MFGTAGIRGIYGKDITEELARKIGYLFNSEATAGETIVIARDTRPTGKTLEEACVDGANMGGMNVLLLGIAPTPTLALATVKMKCNGIMITASHNPPEYNGFKLFKNGKEITKSEEREFENKFNNCKDFGYVARAAGAARTGAMIEEHKNMIKKLVDCNAIAKRKFNVIVDCNGAAATITPYLLYELGCKVTSLNCELEGFNRAGEPNAENLKGTMAIAKAIGADVTFAHDGDGDRCIIIDDKGEILGLDVQLAIMIEHELEKSKDKNRKNKKIVTTVEASLLVREAIERNGGEVIITNVGSVYVSEVLEKENAYFGGEPCGEYVFSEATHAADGVLVAAKFLEIIAQKGRLSELRKKYKAYPILREKFACGNRDKYEIVEKIKKQIKEIKIDGKRNESDGIRIDENDGWFLIRASGTENIVRLTMEYKDKKKLDERAGELRDLIKRFI